MCVVAGQGENKEAIVLRVRDWRYCRGAERAHNLWKRGVMPHHEHTGRLARADGFDQLIRSAQGNRDRLQMQLFRERRGRLLCALQVGREDLLNARVGERVRQALRAPAPGLTERGVRFVGNFVRVADEKNGARGLAARTKTKH